MRLTLTVVDPLGGDRADVVLDAEAESSVGDVARALAGQLDSVPPAAPGAPQAVQVPAQHAHAHAHAQAAPAPAPGGWAAAGPPPAAPPGAPPAAVPFGAPGAPGAPPPPGAAAPAPPPVFVDGFAVDPGLPVAQSPLREGSVVSLYDPVGCPPREVTGLVELRVVGGPMAGAVHRLGLGRVDVGSGNATHIRVTDPELPERAFSLTVSADGTCKVHIHGDQEKATLDGTTFAELAKPKEKSDDDESRRSRRRRRREARREARRVRRGGAAAAAPPLPQEPPQSKDAWPYGAQVAIGNSLFELVRYAPPDAAVAASEDGGGLDYNRPPRLLPPDRETRFKLPSPPKEGQARPLPWLMALMPAVMGVTMCLVMGRWYYLLMAFMSPIIMIGNYFMDKKHGRKSHVKAVAEYKEHKARIEKDARDALVAERNERRLNGPDPALLLSTSTGPRTRLWERRRTDADHLLLRFGTAELDSEVLLEDPEQDEHRRQVLWKIQDAPVTVPLRQIGVLGVAGAGDTPRALGRWAVAQAAVLHSPLDVQFYVLTEPGGQAGWDWMRWLPHARPPGEYDTNALVGTDTETVAARIAELTQLLDARQKAAKDQRSNGPTSFKDPDIVIVFDGSRRLRSLPGVVRLLREGPAVSMFAICLDSEDRFLPGECQAIVVAEPKPEEHDPRAAAGQGGIPMQQVPGAGGPGGAGGFPPFRVGAWGTGPSQDAAQRAAAADGTGPIRLRVEQAGSERRRGVRPDFVSPAWCALVARGLSPVRDISGEAEDAAIPSSSRLLDVVELEPPTGDAIAARWQIGGQSTTAVIGESYDGPFAIDIRKDGPHGLIAGTTGSGKSELLQTIVAALAVSNTPENMTFVLIDYKGGSAFKDCVKLPHTVGMVTDLDNHLVTRALESLRAELHRREHILADAEAKDIEDFQDLLRREPGRYAPLPRLLLVIDEFAAMVRELPDFVTGLVDIAARGRSLGIHLMLATQRPSGVVSPEIRANTNLRIALRVTDGGESADVIDAPDAGFIAKSMPGRAYVRLGHASLVPFQSGRVGGRRPGAADPATAQPWAGRLGWTELGRGALKRPAGAQQEEDEITDLKVLVDAVNEANERLGIPEQHSPWLPALPDSVQLDTLPEPQATGPLPPAPYGIEDLPAQQARRTVAIDFTDFGHLIVGGAPRSGRSQMLRTIAGSLARTHSIADLHLYGIDCGNGALNALTRLPHCGAVVSRNQTERAVRLIGRLKQELGRRQELLAADGFADIAEQRAAASDPEQKLPYVVVLLDRWEGWLPTLGEINHGDLTDEIYGLLREGASVGIHMIITGDRSVLTGRISTLTEDKFAFRLPDRSDFSMISLNARNIPEDIEPGRMFRSESGLETQIAVLSDDLSGAAQAAAVAAIGEAATERDAAVPRSLRPFRVDVLPSRLGFEEAWEMRDVQAQESSKLWALVGVGGDELMGFGPNLADGIPAFIIGGPAKSGRSTVLKSMALTYLQQGVRLVIAAPRPSPMRDLAGREGVLQVFTEDDIDEDEVHDLLKQASPDEPIAVLVDDAEMLTNCDAGDEFKAIARRGAERGWALVLAGDEEEVASGFSGWQVEAKKARRGVALSPQDPSAGDLIGIRLNRGSVGDQVQPGKGLLHLGDGEPFAVTTPLV